MQFRQIQKIIPFLGKIQIFCKLSVLVMSAMVIGFAGKVRYKVQHLRPELEISAALTVKCLNYIKNLSLIKFFC
jgi:hypothetical protein